MKKMLLLVVCVCTCISVFALTIEIETPSLKYLINGTEVEMPEGEQGFMYNDRTYVPIRFIAEALDKNVQWDDATNTVIISDKQPDSYMLKDGLLYKNGALFDIKTDSEVEYKKLYNDRLVYYVKAELEDDYIYDVYLCDLKTMKSEKVDTTADVVGYYKQSVADHIFDYVSIKNENSIGVINLLTGKVNHISYGQRLCTVWDDETIYYSSVNDDGIYKEKIGETAELLSNIDIIGAWILKHDDKLICYSADYDKGAIIELSSQKVISKELTQTEKNSVILNSMLALVNELGNEYEPEFKSMKELGNLEYISVQNNGIIFESNSMLNEGEYPVIISLVNGRGTLNFSLISIGDNKVMLNLDLLNTKDKDTITKIILRQI